MCPSSQHRTTMCYLPIQKHNKPSTVKINTASNASSKAIIASECVHMQIVFSIYPLYLMGIRGMRSHHPVAAEYFSRRADMKPDNAPNINRCNPNSDCSMIAGRPSPLGRAHGMCSTTNGMPNRETGNVFNRFATVCQLYA